MSGLPLFFLHGFGSSAEAFRRETGRDDAFFLEAPEADRFTASKRWFAFTAQPALLAPRIAAAADGVERQIGGVLGAAGHDATAPITLAGHSQGAMIALEIVRRRRLPVVAASCWGGFLPPPLSAGEHSGRPATLHVYSSTRDRYVDPADVERTVRFFRSLPGVDTHHYRTSQLPHAFSRAWLDAANFERIG